MNDGKIRRRRQLVHELPGKFNDDATYNYKNSGVTRPSCVSEYRKEGHHGGKKNLYPSCTIPCKFMM